MRRRAITTVSVTKATKKRIDRIAAERNLTREEVIVLALNALEGGENDRKKGEGRAD
jgi:predicted transcriptional regulator